MGDIVTTFTMKTQEVYSSLFNKKFKLNNNMNMKEVIKNNIVEDYDEQEILTGCPKFVENLRNFNNMIINRYKIKSSNIYWVNDFSFDDRFNMFLLGEKFELIINITNECNNNCRYCELQCDKYDEINEEILMKMINKFIDKIMTYNIEDSNKSYIITIYGGEPLIKFSEIQSIIRYLKANSPIDGKINIVTNGLLLKESIVRFLVENEVYIFINFDGTKDNNKKNKHIIEDDIYDTILNNIIKAKENYPNYNRISIISSYDFNTDLESNDKFFENNALPLVSLLNNTLNLSSCSYDKMSQSDIDTYFNQYRILEKKYKMFKEKKKECSSYLKCLFSDNKGFYS